MFVKKWSTNESLFYSKMLSIIKIVDHNCLQFLYICDCWFIGSFSFLEIWFISIRNHIFQAVSLWLHFCFEAFHKDAEDNELLLLSNGIVLRLSPVTTFLSPCCLMMSLFPLLSLKSSTTDGTKLSSSPLFSPRSSSSHCLPWTSASVSSLCSTSLDNSINTHMQTTTQAWARAPPSSYSCAEIFLLFLLQSLSQTPKSTKFSLFVNVMERLILEAESNQSSHGEMWMC